jgi:hypothetical protein
VKIVGVITTIQEPTACVEKLTKAMQQVGGSLIAVGDRKGPAKFVQQVSKFYSIEQQIALPLSLAKLLPEKHYTRKNLGYLLAMQEKPTCIYETDDDNAPTELWKARELETEALPVSIEGWCNVYRLYSSELIWPRGLPLDKVSDPATWNIDRAARKEFVKAPIQQGLADFAPDVDAVWRLLLNKDVYFEPGENILLKPGTWCPFNSQNTWWWPEAYALMYLPSFCSFRMTDIWRSFVAQRCLWELGYGLVFHPADVRQDRNLHNLMRDFADEVPGYLNNEGIVKCLEGLSLKSGAGSVGDNLVHCYEELAKKNFIPEKEIPLVKAWVDDLSIG